MNALNSAKKQFVTDGLLQELQDVAPDCLAYNVPLNKLSSYKIGGNADVIVSPDTLDVAANVMRCLKKHNVLYTVIGSTSNILFDDAGYRGVLVKIANNNFTKLDINKENGFVRAGSGVWVPCYVRSLINNGLRGCVHAIGIPGALGGLIIMNGGSLRKGIGEQLLNVTIIDEDGAVKVLKHNECKFDYRESALQNINCIVVEAEFQYQIEPDIEALRHEALELLVSRSKKFPRKYPSCGSVFLSYPEMYDVVGPPGKAIEDLGFKGRTQGGAQISPLHANFIVNKGGAKAVDVLSLIHQCRVSIMKKAGFDMRCEVRFLPSDGTLCPAHIQSDRLFA